jgi:hypothetical protein
LGRNVLALLVVVLGEASPASGTSHGIGRQIRNGHARRDAQGSAGGRDGKGNSFQQGIANGSSRKKSNFFAILSRKVEFFRQRFVTLNSRLSVIDVPVSLAHVRILALNLTITNLKVRWMESFELN